MIVGHPWHHLSVDGVSELEVCGSGYQVKTLNKSTWDIRTRKKMQKRENELYLVKQLFIFIHFVLRAKDSFMQCNIKIFLRNLSINKIHVNWSS